MRLLFHYMSVYIRILNLNQPDKMKLSAILTAASLLASVSVHAVAETPAALQPTPPHTLGARLAGYVRLA